MPKAKSRKPARIVALPVAESTSAHSRQPATVTDNEIAERAFAIFCDRGSQHGYDLDDWLQAERELRSTANVAVA